MNRLRVSPVLPALAALLLSEIVPAQENPAPPVADKDVVGPEVAVDLAADPAIDENAGDVDVSDNDEAKKQLRNRKLTAKLLGHLTARINGMKDVCGLSDKQVRLLEIAARGAVTSSVQKGRKQYKDAGLGVVLADEYPMFIAGDTIHIGRRYHFTFLEQETVWKKTLRKTLTPEQLQKHEQDLDQQLRHDRTSVLFAAAAQAEEIAQLTQTQRQKLVQLVDETIGDRRVVIGSRRVGMMAMALATLNVDEKKIEAVLERSQVAALRQLKSRIDDEGLREIRPILLALDGSKSLDEVRKLNEEARLAAKAAAVDDDD